MQDPIKKNHLGLLISALALLFLPACTPIGVVAGLGATAGVAAMQERGITGASRDVSLEMAIHARLVRENPALVPHVGVDVYSARALLTGTVENEDQRADAIRLAWEVEGISDVYNEIEVADPANLLDKSHDAWITARVNALLAMEPDIKSINYSPTTHDRVVYLMGIAQSQQELDRALAKIRAVDYVRKVVSHIRVKRRPRTTTAPNA